MTDKVELSKAILYPNGEVRAVDWAGAINLEPRNWGLIKQLGVFGERFGTQKQFVVTRSEEIESPLLEDRNWETTRPTLGREDYSGVAYKIPHFPVDDMILPSDVDGLMDYTQLVPGSELEVIAAVRARKIKRLRAAHEVTHEFARGYALTTGNVYAPSGTLKTSYGSTINVYNEWGIARQTSTLELGAAANPLASVSQLFADMQGAAKEGDAITGFAVLCSRGLFEKLIGNPYINEVYSTAQLPGRQSLLVGRLPAALGLDARFRSFEYGGILFVEYPAVIKGQAVIPANKGVAIPLGTELGRMHFAPANKLNMVNTVSQASYLWEKMDEEQTKIELKSETNFAAVLDRPDLVRDVDFTA